MSEVTHFWTVSPYYHAGSESVLPTHGSPMMLVWWPTSSSEGVTVCDDKQWRTKQILFTSLFLALFQNLMSCLAAYCLHGQLFSVTADWNGTLVEWFLTLFRNSQHTYMSPHHLEFVFALNPLKCILHIVAVRWNVPVSPFFFICLFYFFHKSLHLSEGFANI